MSTVATPGGDAFDGFPSDLTLGRSGILDNGQAGVAGAIAVIEQAVQNLCGRRRINPPAIRYHDSFAGFSSARIFTLGQHFFPPYCAAAGIEIVASSLRGRTTVEWRIDGGDWQSATPIAPRQDDALPTIGEAQRVGIPIEVGNGDQEDFLLREIEIRLTPPTSVDGAAAYLYHAGITFFQSDSITVT